MSDERKQQGQQGGGGQQKPGQQQQQQTNYKPATIPAAAASAPKNLCDVETYFHQPRQRGFFSSDYFDRPGPREAATGCNRSGSLAISGKPCTRQTQRADVAKLRASVVL
jgi:hypothetical protein